MAQNENFLHTTHRTVSWFKKAFVNEELVLAAPFQRNPVWTNLQKSYLVDTILNGLPIPELYMQDVGNEAGDEKHIVVDGQQRIRAILDFVQGGYPLEGDEVTKQWRGSRFDDLSVDEKTSVFGYKFVVRILPAMDEEGIRKIFARLNRNVVALNEQELRNATYWGPFIKTIQYMADDDSFWSSAGVFSANDHRRMLDHEYISELVAAYLHGPQNKKDKLDTYYQLYEENFDDEANVVEVFRRVTAELGQLIPSLSATRWKKKSDFYTLFLTLANMASEFPWPADRRSSVSQRLLDFGTRIDSLLRLEEDEWAPFDQNVAKYARSVARAASDKASRIARSEALAAYVFGAAT